MESHPRPKNAQQVYSLQKIQNAIPAIHTGGHQARGLPGLDRPNRSLPPHSNSPVSSKVPEILLQRQSFPIQGPSFRSLISTQGVHKDSGSSGGHVKESPNPSTMLLGRHPGSINIPAGSPEGRDDIHSRPSTPWLLGQFQEEPNCSLDQTAAPGRRHRHVQLHGLSLPGAVGRHQGTRSAGTQTTHSSPSNTFPALGQDGFVHRHCALGQTSSAGSPMVPPSLPTSRGQCVQPTGQGAGSSTQGDPLVGLPSSIQRVALQGTGPDYHHDGRQSVRVGSPSTFSLRAGTLVPHGSEEQHQLVGAQGHPLGSITLQTQNQGSSRSSPHGQCGGQSTHKPAGGNQIQSPHVGDTSAIQLGRVQPGINQGGAHLGGQQRAGGLSEPLHSGPVGMGLASTPFLTNLPQVRPPHSRPVCFSKQRPTPQVLLPLLPSGSGGNGCVTDSVATGLALRLSAFTTHTGNHSQAPSRAGGSTIGGPLLASETVVCRSHEPVPVSSVEDSISPDLTASGNPHPSGPSMVTSNRLALERSIMTQEAFSARAITMIQAARRPATNRIYDSTWKNFCLWCRRRQLEISNLTIPQVVDYLLDGLDRGLAPATIRRQVAALSTLLSCHDSVSLAHHPRIRAFIKGACNTRPPVVHRYPSWELPRVLRALTKPPFEPLGTISMKYLSLKVAFLIAITSARRISELAALSVRDDLCIFHNDRVVLRIDPSFIPKVNSLFHRSQEVVLPNFCPNPTHPLERQWHTLDVRRALKRYLGRTEPFRRSEALFISFRSGTMGQKVSAGTIGRWIRTCIAEAYQSSSLPTPSHITAHSTRSAATSAAWATQASIEDVCRAATWSSPSPFIRHYKIDRFASADASFGRRVLQQVVAGDSTPALAVSHPLGQ